MIIQLGEMEWHDLRAKLTLPKLGDCEHKRLKYTEHGDLLECLDCGKQISAVWALKLFFHQYETVRMRLEQQRLDLERDEKKNIIHRAALAVQDAWRARKYLPTCPHCVKPILPIDGFGRSQTSRKQNAEPLILRPNLEIVEEPTPRPAER